MSTLINLKTGQTVSGNTPASAIKGRVVKDVEGNLYIVKRISVDYGTTLRTELTPIDITTIVVSFENSSKLYHYFITRNELDNYKIGDKIKINAPYGISTVTIKDKNINIDHSRATKLIDIVTTHISIPYREIVATVVYEGNDNHLYEYIVDANSCNIKLNQKYMLLPNHAIVKVLDIRTTDRRLEGRFKTFKEISQDEVATTTNIVIDKIDNIKLVDKRTNKIIMEEKTMNFNTNKLFKNLEFGKINTDAIKFSLNGLAFKMSDGSYATYDIDKKEATDVSAFVIDTDFIFAMPVAIKDIKKGDIIKHLDKFMIVEGIFAEDKTISVIDPLAAEEKVLIPVKNAFGFSYYTKIVNIFDGADFKPSEDTPFGNMLPLMLMSEGNMDNSMLFAMMMMNKDENADFMKNPLMMMALINK